MGMEGGEYGYGESGGSAQQPTAPPGHVPNYLVASILVTIFCCLPLGIVAIIFAAQVNGKLAAGDVAGAMEASRKAKLFVMISVVLGLVSIVLAIILQVLVGFAAVAAG